MRDTALQVEQFRDLSVAEFQSDPGELWGSFLIPRATCSLRIISSGTCEQNELAAGWEHVSVSRSDAKMPTWADMMYVKDLFWHEEETVLQFHPKKSEYVNCHPKVLHLWKRDGVDHELPPSLLIGPKHDSS